MKIENNIVLLEVNLNGGSYSDFHFKDQPINPINWRINDPEMPPFMGHFLCFDRWGPPELSEDFPLFHVTEEILNLNKYGRMFNIVQHVTLASPFLDKSTLFDNNTEKGFEDKENSSLSQETPVIKWPEADHSGKKVSLRQFRDKWPRVSTF
ncbi:MAG: hypothetical protein NTZ85_01285, partial [Bacteroidia bacterium]|nr:hypothetical protein [Bacteroidia bacterium]